MAQHIADSPSEGAIDTLNEKATSLFKCEKKEKVRSFRRKTNKKKILAQYNKNSISRKKRPDHTTCITLAFIIPVSCLLKQLSRVIAVSEQTINENR